MNLDLGQRRRRLQTGPQSGRRAGIDRAGYPRGDVPKAVDRVLTGEQEGSQPDGIDPLEPRALAHSLVRVEPVDKDPFVSDPGKARAIPGSSPCADSMLPAGS